MARHALASGLDVAPALMEALEASNRPAGSDAAGPRPAVAAGAPEEADEITRLTRTHNQLANLVAPATPRTILFLEDQSRQKRFWSFLGPVPLVRRLMLAALLFLVGVVGVSLSPQVNQQTISQGVLVGSGPVLLLNLIFLLAAAGLGASFAGLFRANRFVKAGTYNPAHDASYWILLSLGVIAGMILAELVPIGEGQDAEPISKPTLAMVGGFSAEVVYRILTRLVETVETLVRGNGAEVLEARALAERVRLQQQAIEGRSRLAANLMHLRQQVGGKADPDTILSSLDRILEDVAPAEVAPAATKPGGEAKPPASASAH